MSELLRKAFIGLEAETDPLLEEGDEAVDAVVDTVEENAELEEVESGEGGITEIETAIHEVSDAAEALEEVTEFLETKQEEGGLSESDATMLTVATEAIMRKFEGYLEVRIPATESFGGEGGRAAQTSVAIESFKETIEKMWKAVKDFVMGLVAKMDEWFAKHISVGGRLKKSAIAIAKKAGNVGAEKVTLSAANSRLLSNSAGSFAGASLKGDIAKVVGALKEDKAAKMLIVPVELYTAALDKVDLSSVEKVKATLVESSINAKEIFEQFGKEVSGDKRFGNEKASVFAYEPFPIGGKSQFLSVVIGDKPWYMKRTTLKMLPTDPAKEVKEAEVDAANVAEVKAICSEVEKLGDALVAGRKTFGKVSDEVKKFLAKGDSLSKSIASAPDDVQSLEDVKNLKTVLNGFSSLGTVLTTVQPQLASEAASIGWATLAFCAASLKAPKKAA